MNEYPEKIRTKCLEDPLDSIAAWSRCPTCGSDDIDELHHAATFALPECDFLYCNECQHEWRHT